MISFTLISTPPFSNQDLLFSVEIVLHKLQEMKSPHHEMKVCTLNSNSARCTLQGATSGFKKNFLSAVQLFLENFPFKI